jgi:hypothetical protein
MKNIEKRIKNDRDRDLRQARARELRRKRRHAGGGCMLQIVAAVFVVILVRCL